jgi:Ca2+/Na+ antiporter
LSISWRDMLFIIIVPLGLSYVLYMLHIYFVIGIIMTLVLSYALYFKLKLLLRDDIKDSLSILPSTISKPTQKILSIVDKKWSTQ